MVKKSLRWSVLGLTLAVGALVASTTVCNTLARAEAPAKEVKKDAPKEAKKAPAPRPIKLGGAMDTLDLTEAQKQDIKKIRTETITQVKKIQEEGKAKELAVLTPEQQEKFKAAEAEAKKVREDKMKADKEKAATDKGDKDLPAKK